MEEVGSGASRKWSGRQDCVKLLWRSSTRSWNRWLLKSKNEVLGQCEGAENEWEEAKNRKAAVRLDE